MNKLLIVFILTYFLFTASMQISAQIRTVAEVCLSEEELKLAREINDLRKQNRLPEIPLSASLSFVAKTHIWDLQNNKPDTSICTSASWSDKGSWTACCFSPYVLKYDCMWDKPKELTSYPYRGYEMVYYDESIVQADSIFKLWKSSFETTDMLLSKNHHSDKNWLAMGLAIGENYVSVWFGQRSDAAGAPKKCSVAQSGNFTPATTEESKTIAPQKASKYYLIYGSFTTRADANEAIKRYKNSGLPNVSILEKEGRYRIALDKFDNLRDAMTAKEKLSISYPEVWIFKD